MNAEVKIVDAAGNPITASDTAYHGASRRAREFRTWNPVVQSADSELLYEQSALVARSRDLNRNQGFASGGIQAIVDNVVGVGLRLSSRPDYKALGRSKEWAEEWSTQVESLWRSWSETTDCDAARELNFHSLTGLVFRSGLVSGEALALPLWLDNRGTRYATALQLIDPERLSNPAGRPNAKNLRNGIEQNEYGEPLAYWIRKTHPNDWMMTLGEGAEWERIPARTAFGRRKVLHVHDKERTGQSRGKPLVTPIMSSFKMLDHYQRTELQAAIVNSMIAAFIETAATPDQIAELFGGNLEAYAAAREQWTFQLEGGAIIPTFPGDKLAAFTPSRPATGYEAFVTATLRHIAAGMNIPYELLAKDFSKTNYSSARAALLEAWRFFSGRRQWLATYWAQPVFELWLEEAIQRGDIEAPDFYENRFAYSRTRWIGPGRGWIDPVKEAQAAQIRMEMGISTLEDECAEQGKDWEEVLEQRAREMERAKELGVPLQNNGAIIGENLDGVDAEDGAGTEEAESIKQRADAYGVAVRAGVITPQPEDEDEFRRQLQLPGMSEDVRRAWEEDGGVRRPITLVQKDQGAPGGAEPAGGDDGEGGDE